LRQFPYLYRNCGEICQPVSKVRNFGFLQEQKDSGSEAPAPSAFRDLPAPKNNQNGDIRDAIMSVPSTPEDYEDLRHELATH
jgi:hypothetical protein